MKKLPSLNTYKSACFISFVGFLSACSTGDSNSLTSGRGGEANSLLNLDITDAAIDSADEVWVEFTGIKLQPSSDDHDDHERDDDDDDDERDNDEDEDGSDHKTLEFTFDTPKRINLLALQGTNVDALLNNVVIPSGSYDWIRLQVNAEQDGTLDSYIKLDDGNTYELSIPSGSQSGLKLNTGFELITGAEFNFTIDFDLRKSIVITSQNEYKLKPTLRLVNNALSATVTGNVDPALLSTTGAGCTDDDPSTGNAVYIFSNSDVIPDDIDSQAENPLSTALVNLNNSSGNYEYTLGFIPEGDYTITFTCQAESDNPESSDAINFVQTTNISLTPGQVLNFNF